MLVGLNALSVEIKRNCETLLIEANFANWKVPRTLFFNPQPSYVQQLGHACKQQHDKSLQVSIY